MKITIYTIKDCAFSKQEKEYLLANKLAYEEKDLETNKDFLTEMLAISNNFAGTPVTRVEKDDGSIAVLKGFTKEEFDTTFGLVATPTDTPIQPTSTDLTATPPANDTPVPPIATETPAVPPIQPFDVAQGKPTTTDSTDLTDSTVTPDPLKSVMDNLQSKSEPTAPPVAEPVQPIPTDSTVSTDPTVSTAPPAGAPTIPDFPAK